MQLGHRVEAGSTLLSACPQGLRPRLCWPSRRRSAQQHSSGCRQSAACHAGLPASVLYPASLQLPAELHAAPLAQLPIPGLDIFAVLGFLLNNPVVTVALAVAVYVFLPRLWRWVVKRIVAPALLLAAVFFAAQHPAQTVFLGKSVLACTPSLTCQVAHEPCAPEQADCGDTAVIGSNPVLVSGVTIVALAVLLSPYILVAGAVFGLIYGLPQLPPPFNALVPAPVVEVGMC